MIVNIHTGSGVDSDVVGRKSVFEAESVCTRVELASQGLDDHVDLGGGFACDVDVHVLAVVHAAENGQLVPARHHKHFVQLAVAKNGRLHTKLVETYLDLEIEK